MVQNFDLQLQKIKSAGWKQGACILIKDNHDLVIQGIVKFPGWLVLISQDCDIENPCLEKEPWVEFISAMFLEESKKELQNGQNPRELHLKISANNKDKEKYLQFYPYKRFFLPRKFLSELMPTTELVLTSDDLRVLLRWITNRYIRLALPNKFNERFKHARKKLVKILSENIEKHLGLLIRLTKMDELHDDEPYLIVLCLLVKLEYREDSSLRNQFEQIEELFDKEVRGIKIVNDRLTGVRSKVEINIEDAESLAKWDFDYLSGVEGDILNL